MLKRNHEALSPDIIGVVTAMLHGGHWGNEDRALSLLATQSDLSGDILKDIVEMLKLGHMRAANTLRSQSTVPGQILEAVAKILEDKDEKLRQAALKAIGNRSNLPENIQEAVVKKVGDTDIEVREEAGRVFATQSDLSPKILEAMGKMIEHERKRVQLEHEDFHVRWAAERAIGNQYAMPGNILTRIVAKLEHNDPSARARRAILALKGRSSLSHHILEKTAAKRKDEDVWVISDALRTLGNQSNLPEEILKSMAAILEWKEDRIIEAAATALGKQSILPLHILEALLETSLKEHLCWFFNNKKLCIERSGGRVTVDMSDHYSQFMAEWEECRKNLLVPPQHVLRGR
ncbi:ARM repeat-containing protein [Xylaria acuta]|nr:ARM repeat-containing protein [Xylaria acuta]